MIDELHISRFGLEVYWLAATHFQGKVNRYSNSHINVKECALLGSFQLCVERPRKKEFNPGWILTAFKISLLYYHWCAISSASQKSVLDNQKTRTQNIKIYENKSTAQTLRTGLDKEIQTYSCRLQCTYTYKILCENIWFPFIIPIK